MNRSLGERSLFTSLFLGLLVIALSGAAMSQTTQNSAEAEAKKEYNRLLNLKIALAEIPFDEFEKEPHKSFLKKNENDIVYSDPAGEYFVRSERFWDLSEKYKNLAIANDIAWTAAQNPRPGECEGFVNCYVFYIRSTMGRYLEMFPKGNHADEALREIAGQMDMLVDDKQSGGGYEWPTEREDITELGKLLDELKNISEKISVPIAEEVVGKIKKVRSFLK